MRSPRRWPPSKSQLGTSVKFWKQHLADLSGSSVASAAATAVDGIIYSILLWTAVAHDLISVGMAAGLGALFGGGVHFVLSRFWVYQRFDAPLKRSTPTYFAMSWIAAAIHGVLTGFLVHYLGKSGGWAISKGVVWLFWTYPMCRYVVFGGLGARTDSLPS